MPLPPPKRYRQAQRAHQLHQRVQFQITRFQLPHQLQIQLVGLLVVQKQVRQ